MSFEIYEFYLEFMNKGFFYIQSSGFNVSMNEADFNSFLSTINFICEQFQTISKAIGISFKFLNKIYKS